MSEQRVVTTPWGSARVLAEAGVDQESPQRCFRSAVELLERDDELLVRFAYISNGAVRRGPVTLRALDLAALRVEVPNSIELGRALGWVDSVER